MYKIFIHFLILILFNSCVILERGYYKRILDIESSTVLENNNVTSVVALNCGGDFYHEKLRLLITLNDNQWLILSDVSKDQRNIIIESINGYDAIGYRREINKPTTVKFVNIFYKLCDNKYQNINYIINNFNQISVYIDNLTEVVNYDILKPSNWYFSDEANLNKEIADGYETVEFKKRSWKYITQENQALKERKDKWRIKLTQK